MAQTFQYVRNTSNPLSQSRTYTQSNVTVTKSVFPRPNQQNGSSKNLKSSQASYSMSANKPNQFYGSQVGQTSNLFASNVSESSVRQFYKGLGTLPQDRLKQISQSFIRTYGSGGQVRRHQIQKIQQIAHSNDTTRFQQTKQTVNQLFQVMDQNTRDKRVNENDIYELCRRFLNCQKKPIVYTHVVEERLSVARRLFKQFDVQKKGYLTEKQVPNLLSQTYKTLGRDFKATQDDIKSWMKLADVNGNGHVTLVQYERSIIRALKKQGIQIYED